MRAFVTLCITMAVVVVATWAYRVNYETRAVRAELRTLNAAIASESEALQMLEVEWAYLNRPERLAQLVTEHADVLGLMPADPGHYGRAEQIPYPSEISRSEAPPRKPTLPMTLQEALVLTGAAQ